MTRVRRGPAGFPGSAPIAPSWSAAPKYPSSPSPTASSSPSARAAPPALWRWPWPRRAASAAPPLTSWSPVLAC